MSKNVYDSAAAKALAKHLEKGSTGRLTVQTPGGIEVSVHVQQSALLAAESPEDSRQYLRRLRLERAISEARSRALQSLLDAGEPIFGHLLDEVPAPVLDRALADRFRDNLIRFVGSEQAPRFELTAGVFVDNLQFGLDARSEMRDAEASWKSASTVEFDFELEPGPALPHDPFEQGIVEMLDENRAVSSLLAKLPAEPLAARARIARMISTRVVVLRGSEATGQDLADSWEDESDAATEVARTWSDDQEQATDEVPFRRATPDEDTTDPATPPPPSPIGRPSDLAGFEPEAGEEPSSEDPFTAQPARAAQLGSWLSGQSGVEDEMMDAFADYDEDRGSDGRGGFSTQQHNLDRVEVSLEDPPPPEPEEPLEAGEVPQARFGAPTLTDDEAMSRIDVANEALMVIVEMFDTDQGEGSGLAALQIILEGSPGKFSPLFQDVQADEEGPLPYRDLLQNLHTRPFSEQRYLLRDGLVDVIDRALERAAEELSDTSIDTILEKTVGYRQRMGL